MPTAYLLSLSGGGDNGAFGAGLLVGWTAHGDRPKFKLVTGVSTGALIAPFVFLGPEYDAALTDVYTNINARSERGPRWPSLKSLSAECIWEPTGDPVGRRAGVAMLARNRGTAASALLTSVARRAIAGATVSFRRSHRFRRWPKQVSWGRGQAADDCDDRRAGVAIFFSVGA